MRFLVIGSLLLAAPAACRDTTVCPGDLRVGVLPADTTISAGDQFTSRVIILVCGGTQVRTDSLTWSSSDPSVAVVGVRTGVIIGAQPGSAVISVVGKKYGRLGNIHVTVH